MKAITTPQPLARSRLVESDSSPSPFRAIVNPFVDIVVPVLNEEKILQSSIETLDEYMMENLPYRYQITIADNGSQDNTLKIAKSLAQNHQSVRVVRLAKRGRGRALKQVWQSSQADVLTYMDVDLSTSLDDFLPMIQPLVAGEAGIRLAKKDYAVTRLLQKTYPQYVADWTELADDGYVLMTSSYASSDGWLWQPPTDNYVAERYISTVITAVRELEKIKLPQELIEELQLQPFATEKLGLDDGIDQVIADADIRRRLIDNYQKLLPSQLEINQRRCQAIIELLEKRDELIDISVRAKEFAKQTEDCFNHSDVRSDNLAFNPQTGELKLVDWNWASYAPKGSGATEFLVDMARHGRDVTPWLGELNAEMLASFVGFFLIRSLKPPLKPGDNLRQMQALSAAVAYDLLERM